MNKLIIILLLIMGNSNEVRKANDSRDQSTKIEDNVDFDKNKMNTGNESTHNSEKVCKEFIVFNNYSSQNFFHKYYNNKGFVSNYQNNSSSTTTNLKYNKNLKAQRKCFTDEALETKKVMLFNTKKSDKAQSKKKTEEISQKGFAESSKYKERKFPSPV